MYIDIPALRMPLNQRMYQNSVDNKFHLHGHQCQYMDHIHHSLFHAFYLRKVQNRLLEK